MNSQILKTYQRLLKSIPVDTHRFLFSKFNINSRITGLIGPRGTGKTTMLLQFINERVDNKDECIYASLDNIYFSNNLLFNFIEELYEIDGIRYFFLDEVHKYKNWSQETKNAYDSFPDIKIIFSGSSSIDLIKGAYDLSRRGTLYKLPGLSFREFIYFRTKQSFKTFAFNELLACKNNDFEDIAGFKKLLGYFNEYLEYGFYPFVFEDKEHYHSKVLNIINKIIYEDIASFYKLKTENLHYFKRILSYISTIPPGSLSRNNISQKIGLDNKTVHHYLEILQETGLVTLVKENKSGSSILKRTEKIYLNNPNIYTAISKDIGFQFSTGTVREIFFIDMIQNSGNKIYFSKVGDFTVAGYNFEIGGKNKTIKQIKDNLDTSLLVKDNILYKTKYEIPLYLFGFLY